MSFLFRFISLLCEVLTLLILVRVVMSWFTPGQGNPLVHFVYQVTEPVLAPLRRVIPRAGMVDFTPLVAVIMLQLIATFLP